MAIQLIDITESPRLRSKNVTDAELRERYLAAKEHKEKGSGVIMYHVNVKTSKPSTSNAAFRSCIKTTRGRLGTMFNLTNADGKAPTFKDFERMGVYFRCFNAKVEGIESHVWVGKGVK
jgi:uncharacterized protein (DUF849 family)